MLGVDIPEPVSIHDIVSHKIQFNSIIVDELEMVL